MRLPPTDLSVGLVFIAQMEGECPVHWVPLHGRQQLWCGRYCSQVFDLEHHLVLDWKEYRRLALERDGFRCAADGCTNPATEVDHIVEIQDGGDEFDLSNLRSLCHPCHITKTSARRRYGPKVAERFLFERNHPELRPPLEAFL